jgi:ubiquitin C-terminal hydrolase
VLDFRTKFWEHGQLYVALSRVRNPADLCILLPPNNEDFTIRPSVDRDVVEILEAMDSSPGVPIGPSFPVDQIDPAPPMLEDPEDLSSNGMLLPLPDQYFDTSDDDLDAPPSFDDDAAEVANPEPAEISPNDGLIWDLIENQEALRFNCLGSIVNSVPVATIFHRLLEDRTAKFLMTMQSPSLICARTSFMELLLGTQILFSRFLVLHRIQPQIETILAMRPSTLPEEVFGSGIMNPSHPCYINAFVQVLFYILPLRLLVLAWPNSDPIVCALGQLFTGMSERHRVNAIALSRVCEPDVDDAKDCCEFGIQILGALHESSSGKLRSLIENILCLQLTTRFCEQTATRFLTEPPCFFLDLPVIGSATLSQCLDAFFRVIPLDEDGNTRQDFICSFPRFLLIHLGRDVWNQGHYEKDCRRIAFPVLLDLTSYAVDRRASYRYRLGGVISHLGLPQEHSGHYITFLRILEQWVRFDDMQVENVSESAAGEENFPVTYGSTQTAYILLYVAKE